MKVKTYRFKLTHDSGTAFVRVTATSEKAARGMLMRFEGCPPHAIRRAPISKAKKGAAQ